MFIDVAGVKFKEYIKVLFKKFSEIALNGTLSDSEQLILTERIIKIFGDLNMSRKFGRADLILFTHTNPYFLPGKNKNKTKQTELYLKVHEEICKSMNESVRGSDNKGIVYHLKKKQYE